MQEKNNRDRSASIFGIPLVTAILSLCAVAVLLVFAVLAFVNIGNEAYTQTFSRVITGVMGALLIALTVQVIVVILPERKRASKSAVKPAPKVEPKVAPKLEVKPAPKTEPKVAPKLEAKPAPKPEPKVAPKSEAKPEPKVAPKSEKPSAPSARVEKGKNFFLVDRRSGRAINPAELTYESVSASMDHFFAGAVQNKGQLWLPGALTKCNFGAKGEFRAIAAYKMLIDLADADTDGGWRCFCACPTDTVVWIVGALNGAEPNMMHDLQIIKARFSSDPSKIRTLLTRNAPYLKKRALLYVTEHLKDFS